MDEFHFRSPGNETDDSTPESSSENDEPRESATFKPPKFILKANPTGVQYGHVDLPPTQSLQSFIESTHEKGRDVPDVSYSAHPDTMVYGYKYLIHKYQSRCYLSGGLTFKDKLKYVKDDKHTFTAHNIGKDLLQCLQDNVPVIFIPLEIQYHSTPVTHQNLLIYRPFKQLMERFEPDTFSAEDGLDDQLRILFQETLQPVLGEYTPEYVGPDQACPAYKVGLQEVEAWSRLTDINEGKGYCQIWSLFVMESMLMNPDLETSDVVENCFSLSKADPDYLRRMMRGYVEVISKMILADSEYNIKSNKYPTAELPEIHKDLKIQEALNRAAFHVTKRTSPLRKRSASRRVKRTSPEGEASKVINWIKGLPMKTKRMLFDYFKLDGPTQSSILKFVTIHRIEMSELTSIVRHYEESRRGHMEKHREEIEMRLDSLNPVTKQMLADHYKVDVEHLENTLLEDDMTEETLKRLVDALLLKKYSKFPNSQRSLRQGIDELSATMATQMWNQLSQMHNFEGPYDPETMFDYYVAHSGLKGFNADKLKLLYVKVPQGGTRKKRYR